MPTHCERCDTEPDIEITPEMLEAGMDCFYDLPMNVDLPSQEDLALALSRAFVRMHEVRIGRRCEVL